MGGRGGGGAVKVDPVEALRFTKSPPSLASRSSRQWVSFAAASMRVYGRLGALGPNVFVRSQIPALQAGLGKRLRRRP